MRALFIDRKIASPRIPRMSRTPRKVSRNSLRFPRMESHVRESLTPALL